MKGLAWKSAADYQSIAKLSDLPAILAVPADARWKTLTISSRRPKPIRAS